MSPDIIPFPPSADRDPAYHAALEAMRIRRARNSHLRLPGDPFAKSPAFNRIDAHWHEAWDKVVATPATTLRGVIAKAQVLSWGEYDDEWCDLEPEAAASLINDLRCLSRGAKS